MGLLSRAARRMLRTGQMFGAPPIANDIPLYHRTPVIFEGAFQASSPENGMGRGVYFHTNPQTGAGIHGDSLIEARGPKNLWLATPSGYGDLLEQKARQTGLDAFSRENAEAVAQDLRRQGFSGIRIRGQNNEDEILVFEPSHIRRVDY